MSTATTDSTDESIAIPASSSASISATLPGSSNPGLPGGSYRDDDNDKKKAGGGGGTDDKSGSDQGEEGDSGSFVGSDFEPLRRFRDDDQKDDQNDDNLDINFNLDGPQFEPLPPLHYEYGHDAENNQQLQLQLQEDADATEDLDPTLLTLLARLGQDDDDDDQVDGDDDNTGNSNNNLDALAGDYREPTSGIANLDEDEDEDDLLLLDYNYNHGGLDDPAFREALETGAALTAVFDDDHEEGGGSTPTASASASASASDEASVENKDVGGNLDLAEFGGLTLGTDEPATATAVGGEEIETVFEPAEEEGSSSDAAAFVQEFNPYLGTCRRSACLALINRFSSFRSSQSQSLSLGSHLPETTILALPPAVLPIPAAKKNRRPSLPCRPRRRPRRNASSEKSATPSFS